MDVDYEEPGLPLREGVSPLSRFCQGLLASLPRSDQRRWGEVYVRGLLSVPGRKSIRRISDHIVGRRADQSLQQFVNQSTWRWESVRRSVAGHLSSLFRPRAWVVQEAAFPKNGSNSVGVARQYAPSVGRVLNCQLGLGLFFLGERGGSPIDWRLLLPPEWDADPTRRARVHLPDGERHQSRWQYVLDMLDETIREWDLAPAPVVVDASHSTNVEPLLLGLEERGLRYVVRIAAGTPVRAPAIPSQREALNTALCTAGEAAALPVRSSRTMVSWRNLGDDPGPVSRFVLDPLTETGRPGRPRARVRQLLAEWTSGAQRPHGLWLTNLAASRLPELIALARSQARAVEDMNRLRDDLGLGHFEGRSFGGWHRHVTLVSLADSYTMGRRYQDKTDSRSLSSSFA